MSTSTSKEIPASFLSSFKSWMASGDKEGALAEERLLRRLSTFRANNEADSLVPSSANARIKRVQLTAEDKGRFINMLSITPTSINTSSDTPTTVVLHGYGAGLGFFSLNLEALSQWSAKRGLPVYLLDWLGMGRSARVPFKITAKSDDISNRVSQAETFFLDSLEEWRVKMGINRMTLVGHSLGGYLSLAYALRYPTRVSRIILLSPAGIPAGPDSTEPAQEVEKSQIDTTTEASPDVVEPTQKSLSAIKKDQIQEKQKESIGRRLVRIQIKNKKGEIRPTDYLLFSLYMLGKLVIPHSEF